VEALPATGAALLYAKAMHDGQTRRSDGAPFILHPIEVASLLHDAGAPDHLIAAGILHDTIEKTAASAGALRRRFGRKVASLVVAVTEDPGIGGYAGRKAALRAQVADAGEQALMLFAADKAARVHELRVTNAATPQRRLAHYRSSLRLLEDRLPDSALTARLRDELARLGKLPRVRSAAR
jgi:(p)ppGpp synthase/HD superfamily hydrolase